LSTDPWLVAPRHVAGTGAQLADVAVAPAAGGRHDEARRRRLVQASRAGGGTAVHLEDCGVRGEEVDPAPRLGTPQGPGIVA
jgi:hypothetical protein